MEMVTMQVTIFLYDAIVMNKTEGGVRNGDIDGTIVDWKGASAPRRH